MEPAGPWGRTSAPFVLVTVLLSAPGQSSGPAAAPSPEAVRGMISELGPRQAAEQVSNDSTFLEAVASGVASARREWLDVGVQLLGPAEDYLKDRIVEALGYALQHDPTAVLERGAAGVPLDAVCGYDPFRADDNPPTLGQFFQALAARERAVARVTRADLASAKGTCLAALAQRKAAGARQYAP